MTPVLIVLTIGFFLLSVALVVWAKWLERQVAARDAKVTATKRECERLRQQYQAEAEQAVQEAQVKAQQAVEAAHAALTKAQALVDEQQDHQAQEAERIRLQYDAEARRAHQEMRASFEKTLAELEPLRKYAGLGDAETEVRRVLAEAITEATAVREEAKALLEQSRGAGAEERAKAQQKAKDIYEQANARLDQAIRDAGRIVAEAEKRAEKIGGDAYSALRDKELLEHAAAAMRNMIEGYGDRYVVPTHSLLDDLAAEFGYDSAGESLRAARDQSRRMVEQGQAATCDYVEVNRRETAIRFVVHAFNGHVDSLLTRVRHDNYGVLEQKIRDAFSIVNKDGAAFRNARIQPAYLDARLAELKWAVVVQELALRAREEQRYQNERRRDEEKARREQEEQMRQADKEAQIKKSALEEAERRLATAHADERARLELEVERLRRERDAALEHKLTIAQQTNKGRIYVISNVGSFRDDIYKIGLTRRAAQERVDELGGASVPFEFDIHAVIETENAPALEYKLHSLFMARRVNKINLRKEFFQISLSEVRAEIEKLKEGEDFLGTVTWTEAAKAQQYYDTLDIEKNPEDREKWLARQRRLAERRRQQDTLVLAAADGSDPSPESQIA